LGYFQSLKTIRGLDALSDLVREVSIVLPLLDSTGAKMLSLEGVVGKLLEVEGCVLAERVVDHMLTCFQSWDPNASLEPVV
jgi:hypothetical protein